MAGSKDETLVQVMWELLICPVCRDLYDNPKMLPCVHSFCQRCLEGVSARDKETLQCPVCRVPTRLPQGGVAGIPNNFFLNSILDIVKRHSARTNTRDDMLCHSCYANVLSSLRCADCDVLLCTKCLKTHDVDTTNHAVTSAMEPMTSNGNQATTEPMTSSGNMATALRRHKLHIPLKCKHHPKQELRFFCSSCAELTCTDCVIASHVTHIFVSACDAVPSCKAKLNTLLGQMTTRILFLSDAVREIRDTEGQLRTKVRDIRDTIETMKGTLLAAQGVPKERLTEDQKRILAELNAVAGKKLHVLSEQRSKLETRLGLIETCRSFTSDLMTNGSDNELLMMENCIMESLGDLCQHTPEMPIECEEDGFIALENAPQETVKNGQQSHGEAPVHEVPGDCGGNVLGRIITGAGVAECCFATGEGVASAVVGQNASFTVTVKNHHNRSCVVGGRGSIVARIKTPLGGYFCADAVDQKPGRRKFRYRTYIAGPHLLRISIRGEQILGSPFELLSNGSTDYSRRGGLLTKFGRVGDEPEEFSRPQGLAVDRLSRVYVADTGNHRVQVFNEKGKFLFSFGHQGVGPSEFNEPCDVTITRTGHVIVADKLNDRLQVFTCDGKFLSEVRSGMRSPSAVTTDNYNNTIVVDSGGTRVLVFTAAGDRLRSITRGERELENVQDVACSQTGELFVISRLTNDQDGIVRSMRRTYCSLIQSYDNNGHFIQEFVTPSYATASDNTCRLVTDSDDRVLATGSGNKVQVFTTAGGHLTNITFMEKDYKHIEIGAIALTPNGSVAVADVVNARILVF